MRLFIKESAGMLIAVIVMVFLVNRGFKERALHTAEMKIQQEIVRFNKSKIRVMPVGAEDTSSFDFWTLAWREGYNELLNRIKKIRKDLEENPETQVVDSANFANSVYELYRDTYLFWWFRFIKSTENTELHDSLLSLVKDFILEVRAKPIAETSDGFFSRRYSGEYVRYTRYRIDLPSIFYNGCPEYGDTWKDILFCTEEIDTDMLSYSSDSVSRASLFSYWVHLGLQRENISELRNDIINIYRKVWKDTTVDSLVVYSSLLNPDWLLTSYIVDYLKNKMDKNYIKTKLADSFSLSIHNYLAGIFPEWNKNIFKDAVSEIRLSVLLFMLLVVIVAIIVVLPFSLFLLFLYEKGQKTKVLAFFLLLFPLLPPFLWPELFGQFWAGKDNIFILLLMVFLTVLSSGLIYQSILFLYHRYLDEENSMHFLFLRQMRIKSSSNIILLMWNYIRYFIMDIFNVPIKKPIFERYVFLSLNYHILHVIIKYISFIIDAIMILGILVSSLGSLTPGEQLLGSLRYIYRFRYVNALAAVLTVLIFMFLLKVFLIMIMWRIYPDIVGEVE